MSVVLYEPGGGILPMSRPSSPAVQDPGGSITWLGKLEKQLRARRWRIQVYDDYYRGKHRLQFATPKFRSTFGWLFSEFADNWCQIVVDSVAERLKPQGFRMGGTEGGDRDIWRIWQANSLDRDMRLGITEALIREESAVIVWNDPGDAETPLITVEDPSQVVVAYSSENRRKRAAALRLWIDDDGVEMATVYLPDAIYKYRARNGSGLNESIWRAEQEQLQARPYGGAGPAWGPLVFLPSYLNVDTSRWVPREVPGEVWPLPNPLGVVPVVPLTNRPRLLGPGQSEIQQTVPLQDAGNKFMTDMLIASEYGAFQQRWATGIDIPVDPVTKQPLAAPFVGGPGDMHVATSKDARFGAFPEMRADAYVKAIETTVQHIASQSRTPPHYFYLSGQFPSGEAIKSAETGLVAKVRDRQISFGESLEEVARLAFLVLDDPRGLDRTTETIWADPESRTESQHVDAVVKRLALGVPQRQLQEDVGYSQTQIDRFQEMRLEELAMASAAAVKAAELGLPSINGSTATSSVVPGGPGAPTGMELTAPRERL